MFRASTCPSSGGKIVLSQYLVSSVSINGCTVCRMRADCSAVCSHCNVTYMLLMNKRILHEVGKWNKSILWCTVRKTSKYWNIFATLLAEAIKTSKYWNIFATLLAEAIKSVIFDCNTFGNIVSNVRKLKKTTFLFYGCGRRS